MMIVSRKRNERILIGQDIEISVLSIEGDRVRIGIEAPIDVAILRKEILDRDGFVPSCQSREKRCGR